MKPIKLSVAIATYNEEQNLARCLDSIKGWVEEIVLVDGSSTDKTREIARKYGALVIETSNKPIFHHNKQMAIDRCQGEWILQLDADEVVDKDLKEEILSIAKGKGGDEFAGYWIPRKNYFLGKWLKKTGQYPDPVIRFFRKGKGKLPCKSVHEQIEIEGNVGWLRGHLLHYGSPTFSRYLARENRYSTLEAQQMIKKKEKTSFLSFLDYMAWLPFKTWFLLFFRHKGFMDGFPGFVFSLFSGFHYLWAYVKFWEMRRAGKGKVNIASDWE